MKLSFKIISAATIALALFTINANAADNTKDKIVATVNGKIITENTLSMYIRQRNLPPGHISPQQRKDLIEELINRELVYQDAMAIGIDKSPAVKEEIEHQRVNIIASAMITPSSDRFVVSDADLKKEYDARKDELSGKELKARHILLESEDKAKEIIAMLNKGEKFADLAKKYSTGPSAPNGGDLGWFRIGQMVKPFSDAANKLAKGAYTKQPVKTQYGWHVILLEDSREVSAPDFDSIKEQIRVGLQNRLISEYIADLRGKAKIELK